MTVGDVDVSVGCDGDVIGQIEGIWSAARNASLAERHQHFSFRAELEYLLAFSRDAGRVGNPEVSFGIDDRSMRKEEHVCSKGGEEFAVLVVFENRRLAASFAGVEIATLDDVDGAVGGGFHGGDRGPFFEGGWQFSPGALGAVRLGQIVGGFIGIAHLAWSGGESVLADGQMGSRFGRRCGLGEGISTSHCNACAGNCSTHEFG